MDADLEELRDEALQLLGGARLLAPTQEELAEDLHLLSEYLTNRTVTNEWKIVCVLEKSKHVKKCCGISSHSCHTKIAGKSYVEVKLTRYRRSDFQYSLRAL